MGILQAMHEFTGARPRYLSACRFRFPGIFFAGS